MVKIFGERHPLRLSQGPLTGLNITGTKGDCGHQKNAVPPPPLPPPNRKGQLKISGQRHGVISIPHCKEGGRAYPPSPPPLVHSQVPAEKTKQQQQVAEVCLSINTMSS